MRFSSFDAGAFDGVTESGSCSVLRPWDAALLQIEGETMQKRYPMRLRDRPEHGS